MDRCLFGLQSASRNEQLPRRNPAAAFPGPHLSNGDNREEVAASFERACETIEGGSTEEVCLISLPWLHLLPCMLLLLLLGVTVSKAGVTACVTVSSCGPHQRLLTVHSSGLLAQQGSRGPPLNLLTRHTEGRHFLAHRAYRGGPDTYLLIQATEGHHSLSNPLSSCCVANLTLTTI